MNNIHELVFLFNRYLDGTLLYNYEMWTTKPERMEKEWLEKIPFIMRECIDNYNAMYEN